MAGRLQDKVVVITGTGEGMARQVAMRLASEGALIIGCDVNAVTAQETLDAVRASGGQMESLHPLDLSEEESAHRLLEFAVETYGGIDVLHNNAMQLRLGRLEDLSLADWSLTLTHTLTVPFLVTKHAIPHLRARGGGSITFMGSVSGVNVGAGYPGNLPLISAYAIAKAGVIRMARLLANDLAQLNIRVNTISPGCVATPNGLAFYGEEGTDMRRVTMSASLIPRLGSPEDIASALVYLASDDASWVTGHNLEVDGGYLASGTAGVPSPDGAEVYAAKMDELAEVDHWQTSGARA